MKKATNSFVAKKVLSNIR